MTVTFDRLKAFIQEAMTAMVSAPFKGISGGGGP
jgi:hypothetical protein